MKYTPRYLFAIAFLLLIPFSIWANDAEYSISTLSENLKKDAFAVIRNYSSVFIQSDMNNATYKVTYTITILNENGKDYAHFSSYGDKFRTLSSFSGIVRNASGKIVRKIKKGDLTFSSLSDQSTFESDNYSIYYDCQSPSYPFTVEYTYEQKWKNGILSYPAFYPVKGYYLSVEQSEMVIEMPLNTKLRYKDNYNFSVEDLSNEKQSVKKFSLKNFEAIKKEPYSPSSREVLPCLLMAPGDFCYDSYCGNMDSWKNYGLWVSKLLKGRDELPADFVDKLKDLTSKASSDREKTKILYEYLQNNTRYISIQLGIGGYQPFPAASVAKTGFGDCKGLSNLMKAMLKSVGINSNYCAISTIEKDLFKDYANFNQMNHAILLVPLKNDSIWLECTNQTLPFGYVHEDIAGHDALVIDENGGGVVCKLPSYGNVPTSCTKLEISVDEDGVARGDITFNELLDVYEGAYFTFKNNDREKHVKYVNSYLKVPSIEIGEITAWENKSEYPSTHMNARFTCKDFANKTGSRLFIPLCPINKGSFSVFSAKERSLDIEFDTPFFESDTIVINIPESYIIESLTKDVDVKNKFGMLSVKAKQEGQKLFYIQNINVFRGRYDKSDYEALKAFYNEISSIIKRKLVLKKQS